MNAAHDQQLDAENVGHTPRFDHNFLVSIQTSAEVPAVELSKLITAFDEANVSASALYVGTIDYGN